MSKWVLVVMSKCSDAAGEAEFNEWYDKIHVPDILETPGFIRATRYENIIPQEGEAKFLAIYDIESDDLDKVMKVHRNNVARTHAEGRFSELFMRVSSGVYRQITSLGE